MSEPITPMNAAVVAYMAECMAMTAPFDDQEQNWICGHLATFGHRVLETMKPDPSQGGSSAGSIRHKGVYIGAPACFALEEAIRPVCEAFGAYQGVGGCYVVGSALERPDWRDVDIRLMLDDAAFAAEFPEAVDGHWESDTRWLLLTVAISEYLSKRTGLPVDFQFQPQTHANTRHKGRRNAIGIRLSKGLQAEVSAQPSVDHAIDRGFWLTRHVDAGHSITRQADHDKCSCGETYRRQAEVSAPQLPDYELLRKHSLAVIRAWELKDDIVSAETFMEEIAKLKAVLGEETR